jgi:hypothetical protein
MAKTLDESWIMEGLPRSAVVGERPERHRQVRSSYIRSPYALEYNPWSSKGEIEDAIFYRGVIVSAFAQIETSLGEVAIRASRLPQCHALRENFPFQADRRIAFLRTALAVEPFARFESVGARFLDKFETIAALRHMMAHGRMRVLSQITFQDIPHSDGTAITMRRQTFVLAGLEVLAWRSAKLARTAHRLLSRLNDLNILPTLDDAS